MAGIGFELKKLFRRQSLTAKFSAVLYSVFSTIGHLLVVIGALISVKLFLLNSSMPLDDQRLYSSIILYSFVFPLIFTSGLCIIISRYLADLMWLEKTGDILASVYGALVIYSGLASIPALVLLWQAQMGLVLSVLAYILYMMVGIIFILMVYVSALKDYAQISGSFIAGMIVAFGGSYLAIQLSSPQVSLTVALVGSFALGMTIVAAGILMGIKKYFRVPSTQYFDFLIYMGKYPSLFWFNTFYTLGIYVQNFIFWGYYKTQNSISVFFFSDDFDMATALGVLTILPAIVLFVVRMETSFYDYFREYLQAVNTLTGAEIERAKERMRRSMWQEFFFVAELQILISLVSVVVGIAVLPLLGLSMTIVEVFPNMVAGFLFTYFMFLACTLMQYFENYLDCLRIMTLFLLLNTIFTILTAQLGPEFYGLGIVFASTVSLIAALLYLKKTLDSVDYIIFCSRVPEEEAKGKNLESIINRLNGQEDVKQGHENLSQSKRQTADS
jgi:uncharacterized membrane protein